MPDPEEHHCDQTEAFSIWCNQLEAECSLLGKIVDDDSWLDYYRHGLSPEEVASRYGED